MKHVAVFLCSFALLAVVAPRLQAQHGVLSELSAVDAPPCEHRVPETVCVLCHPTLAASFQAVGDWCRPHNVPESQCFRCSPNLTFDPLPPMPDNADVRDLGEEEALAGLDGFVVPGKVTIFAFDAPWCVACRALQGHIRTLLASENRLAMRRVSVPSWEGPVFDRYLREVTALPYVIVYGPDGQRLGALERFDHSALDQLIAGALAPTP